MINNLEISLIDEISGDTIKDLTIEYSELVLDSFLQEGVLKEIPFFGTLYKSYLSVSSIRDKIFAKKIYKFLYQLKDINKEKRQDFVNKVASDDKLKKRAGETLLMLLERLDDLDKPSVIGNLFKATIEEKISYERFFKLSSIVSKSFLPDLYKMKNYKADKNLQRELSYMNLYETRNHENYQMHTSGHMITRNEVDYAISQDGKDIITYGLEQWKFR